MCSSDLARAPNLVPLSALDGTQCERLLAVIDARLASLREVAEFTLACSDGASIAWLYQHGQVLDRSDEGTQAHLRVSLAPADRARFEHRLQTGRAAAS